MCRSRQSLAVGRRVVFSVVLRDRGRAWYVERTCVRYDEGQGRIRWRRCGRNGVLGVCFGLGTVRCLGFLRSDVCTAHGGRQRQGGRAYRFGRLGSRGLAGASCQEVPGCCQQAPERSGRFLRRRAAAVARGRGRTGEMKKPDPLHGYHRSEEPVDAAVAAGCRSLGGVAGPAFMRLRMKPAARSAGSAASRRACVLADDCW